MKRPQIKRSLVYRGMSLLLVMGLALGLAACGDDDDDNGDPFANSSANNQEPNNGEPNNGEPNNGEPNNGEPNNGEPNNGEPNNGEPNNGEPNNGEPNNGEPNNQEEPDEPVEISTPCGTALDIGELVVGETSVSIDFGDFDGSLDMECNGSDDGDTALILFNAPNLDTGQLSIDTDGLDAEVRPFDCDGSPLMECSDQGLNFIPQLGVFHYLVVNSGGSDVNTAELQFNFEELEDCSGEAGESSCIDDSTVEACQQFSASPDIPRWITNECPSGTCSDGVCEGDSCDNPIVVEGSFSWSGTNLGLFNNHNSYEEVEADPANATCLVANDDGTGTAVDTEGRELVFEVVGLEDDQVVFVEADYDPIDDLYIIFKEDCSSESACTLALSGESEAAYPTDGLDKMYVFVDTFLEFEGSFDISIEVMDNP